jgi:Mlc titration factor MtfA (ptsG expression regulator)
LPLLILFSVIILALLIWFLRKRYIQSQRNNAYHKPFNPEWLTILEKNVSLYKILPDELREELHGCINVFLHEKEFIGQDGFVINDEVKLTIAANACLLLLQGEKQFFPDFTSIIIYPATYVAKQTSYDGVTLMHETSTRAGESWVRGPVVLSWTDVLLGSKNAKDGHNVVIHEFAHKLDEQSGSMNGLPLLRESSHYHEWNTVLSQEFIALQERTKNKKNKVMDEYGTISPAEFFAVATESFFEKPRQMKNRLPNLYEQLNNFYHTDPATWLHPK